MATMTEGADVLEYLELQGSMKMVNKSQLLERVRRRGVKISDRQLTSLISEGVIPKSVRIGSRTGAWPEIVGDLLSWVLGERDRGLSVEAIRELLPLWKFLMDSYRAGRVSLSEFEYIARQHVTNPEAVFAAPSLFYACAPCPYHADSPLKQVVYVDKAGTEYKSTDAVSVEFVFAQNPDDDTSARPLARTRITLPQAETHDEATTVVLGVPVGVPVDLEHSDESHPEAADNEAVEREEEVVTQQEESI